MKETSDWVLETLSSFTRQLTILKTTISSRTNWPGAGLRCASERATELSVTAIGTIRMHQSSVHSWDFQHTVWHTEYTSKNSLSIVFSTGAIAISSGVFEDDLESALVKSVDCSGNETDVLDCSLSLGGTCSAEHSAGIICQGKSNTIPFNYLHMTDLQQIKKRGQQTVVMESWDCQEQCLLTRGDYRCAWMEHGAVSVTVRVYSVLMMLR